MQKMLMVNEDSFLTILPWFSDINENMERPTSYPAVLVLEIIDNHIDGKKYLVYDYVYPSDFEG